MSRDAKSETTSRTGRARECTRVPGGVKRHRARDELEEGDRDRDAAERARGAALHRGGLLHIRDSETVVVIAQKTTCAKQAWTIETAAFGT